MITGKNKRLEQLTGLRYFAALLVFVSHLNWNNSSEIIQTVFFSGYVGVSFFFILSGFVLSYSYQSKILSGEITLKRYLFLRLARLSPLHFATIVPLVGLAIYKGRLYLPTLLLNISYLQSWIPHSSIYFSFNSPSWSLSNEMFFYVCFFFLVRMSFKNLFKSVITLLFIVFSSAVVITSFFDGVKIFGSNNSFAYWLFNIFPGFRILEFTVGMILFRLWSKGFVLSKSYILPSYVLLFTAMYYANKIPEAFKMSLFFLPVTSIFLFSHLGGKGLINKVLSSKLLVLLGNASFAFYLIHQPLIHLFTKLLVTFQLSDFTFFIIVLVIISMLSVATYLIYEKWAERKLKEYAVKLS